MPEGPEVRLIAGDLHELLAGRWVVKCCIYDQKVIIYPGVTEPKPEQVDKVTSHGKHTIIHLETYAITIWLGMAGTWSLNLDNKHAKLCLLVGKKLLEPDHFMLNYAVVHSNSRFGKICLMPLTEVEKYISANIGPDLLGEEILEQDWVTTWQTYANRYPNRTICQALLDQRLYAGVGNYLKDEILYQLKWHPGRSLKSLSCPDLQSLYRAVILLIHEAYLQGGTTLRNYVRPRGEMGGFQHQLKVYGRSQCPEQHALLNGGQFKDGRSTTWCDQCQTIQ